MEIVNKIEDMSNKVEMEMKDLYTPASVAFSVVLAGFLSRKLTGYTLGIKTSSAGEAFAGFALITAMGGIAAWKNKEKKTE